jgi:hypothetical protein
MPTFEHQSQINIVATLVDCPYNIQHNPTRTTTKDGSTWPLTCERWHNAYDLPCLTISSFQQFQKVAHPIPLKWYALWSHWPKVIGVICYKYIIFRLKSMNLRLITTSPPQKMALHNICQCWTIAIFFVAIGIICWYKVVHYSHA